MNDKAEFIPDKFSFSGPEKDDYVCNKVIMCKGNFLRTEDHFIVFDNLTILDTTTLLIWQKSVSNKQISFYDADTYINQLNQSQFAGYSDWRLPSLEELKTLLENKQMKGGYLINPVFDNMSNIFWSSTNSEGDGAWYFDFRDGSVLGMFKSRTYFVRAVRSGQ